MGGSAGGSTGGIAGTSLRAEPAVVVNATTEGVQLMRTVGARAGSGHAVAWLSGDSTLRLQAFDAAGAPAGSERTLALALQSNDNVPSRWLNSAVAVLPDGGAVVAYGVTRQLPPVGTAAAEAQFAVAFQRFDAQGARVQDETVLVSRTEVPFSRSSGYGEFQAVALADGGFALGWMQFFPSSVNVRSTFTHQRFGPDGRALGAAQVAGRPEWPGTSSHRMAADLAGGYTVTSTQPETFNQDLVSVVHVDASGTTRTLVAPRAGSTLLLSLRDGSRCCSPPRAPGARRQALDREGQPTGAARSLPAMPTSARELADSWPAAGQLAVAHQRQPAAHRCGRRSRGAPVTLTGGGAFPAIAALAGGGVALAWTDAGQAGDTDVYGQRVLVGP